jgi:hypothetical protein
VAPNIPLSLSLSLSRERKKCREIKTEREAGYLEEKNRERSGYKKANQGGVQAEFKSPPSATLSSSSRSPTCSPINRRICSGVAELLAA